MKNDVKKKDFYRSNDYKGKVPWKLKIGRVNLPDAIKKVQSQENTKDRVEWIKSANQWLKYRSNGTENGKYLRKEEIKERKKELGKILSEYNRYYSEDGVIKY
ncbi:MAG: hypothetical protein ACJ0CN_00070 [Candidatus Poseidoniaceae archaeon]